MENRLHDPRNPELREGQVVGGHRVRRIAALPEIRAVFYELEHGNTGARHIHVSADDVENTFSVAFKTVPRDSTGVAHILEHTVLCGSKRYPVRDPFFSMIKRSLNTFMNAFTASDWTMYPFSTANRKDFFNLLGVYLDAAFFPNIDAPSFSQEGHRLEYDGEGVLQRMGVVYNEMKGAMSAQNQIHGRALMRALYPDVTYGNNSGGEPADIPDLTHEQLVAFHKVHYHPSNAYFFTYGDLPLADILAVIEEEVLAKFGRIDPGTDVPNQPRWDAPKAERETYPAVPGEAMEKEAQVTVAWLTPDIQDTRDVLGFALLDQVLLGNSAAPLRKALIESGIGTALSDGTGFDPDNRDTFFGCGLKGVGETDADRIEALIFDTLNRVVADGVDSGLVEAAIHQLEFHRKEISNTPYPYGLKLLLGIGATWFHGGDPLSILQFDEDLDAIRQEMAAGYFENLIRTWLLDNPHRVRFVLAPDADKQRKMDAEERQALDAIEDGLSDAEKAVIREQADALRKLQETEEDLSSLPTLEKSDIPSDVKSVRPSRVLEEEVQVFDSATSGIFYTTLVFGAGHLPERLFPLVPIFNHVLTRVGTKGRSHAEIAQAIDLATGGIGLSASHRSHHETGELVPHITLSGKALYRNREAMFDLLSEFLTEFSFRDTDRLRTLLLEFRAGLEAAVVQNGHRLAMSLAARNLTESAALGEVWHGVHQIRLVKELVDGLEAEGALEAIAGDLEELATLVFNRKNMKGLLIGETGELPESEQRVQAIRSALPDGEDGFRKCVSFREDVAVREGWSTASAVSFVASVFDVPRLGHPDAPVLAVIAKLLRSLFLHKEIREKGGAYGGFSVYNSEDGLFCFASYRDPHILRTLDVYREATRFLLSGAFTETDIKEAILQVASEIDRPETPSAAARKSFFRSLAGLDVSVREAFKKGLVETDRDRVLEVASAWFTEGCAEKAVAVVSGKELLETANRELGGNSLALHVI